MNKGIVASSGEYLIFNSDDILVDNFLNNANKILSKNNIDILYSNIIYKKFLFSKYITGEISKIIKLEIIYHTPEVNKKTFLSNMNNFDTSYKISADFDFFIKAKNHEKTNYHYYKNTQF